MEMIRTVVCAGLVVFASCGAFGQSTAAPPAFEVASIKPAKPQPAGMIRIGMGGDPGRINYSNVSLRDCIRTAYRVKDHQISGPDWLGSERFDIVATLPPNTPREQIPLMLQGLLAERFKLTFHRETKELPVYALVVGKNGPKLKEAEATSGDRGNMKMMGGHMEAQKFAMGGLADYLSRMVARPVLDMTELKGSYDFTLDFSMEDMQRMLPAGVAVPMERLGGGPEGREPSEGTPGPSIFTALQEQLVLKLESRKGPVEILVIDRVEKVPTEN